MSFSKKAGNSFTLHLINPPLDDAVIELVEYEGGRINRAYPEMYISIRLAVAEVTFLRKLATASRRVPGKGRRYSVANWKWVAPRTADSLNRLGDHLMEYRRLRGTPNWPVTSVLVASSNARQSGAESTGQSSESQSKASRVESADDEDIFQRLARA